MSQTEFLRQFEVTSLPIPFDVPRFALHSVDASVLAKREPEEEFQGTEGLIVGAGRDVPVKRQPVEGFHGTEGLIVRAEGIVPVAGEVEQVQLDVGGSLNSQRRPGCNTIFPFVGRAYVSAKVRRRRTTDI